MYQQFFNFNTEPFSIAPDPHFIFMSEHHQEGLAHLLYGIKQGGGFIALTGEVGTGKTTLCHCLLKQLPDHVDIALVLNPKINSIELLATVCDELQIAYSNKNSLKGLIDKLNLYLLAAHGSGRRTVLMIDEAQNLSLDALEQVRLLTNLETSKNKLLQIILIGQPELKQLLEQPALRQLNQRITARYHLMPLSLAETQKYIKHRLGVCGGNTNIFSPKAIKKVYKLSNGIPRLINILCDRALLGAYVTNTQSVTAEIIKKAAKEVFNHQYIPIATYFKNIVLALGWISFLIIAMHYLAPVTSQKQQIILSGTIPESIVINSNKQKSIDVEKNSADLLKPKNFKGVIEQQNISINTAISRLAKIWNKNIAANPECKEVEKTGLSCLLDKSNWKNLIALNRPVIMEFPQPKSGKFYALLIGLKQGNPVFLFEEEMSFPLEQILVLWKGYFLMFWQPPVDNIKYLYPKQSSQAVLWIREQKGFSRSLGSLNPALFDEKLKSEVLKFQRNNNLFIDGIVGPRTFIHLNKNDLQNHSPKLKLDY